MGFLVLAALFLSTISDLFVRSLTLVRRSLFGNRTETLATEAKAAQKLNRSKKRTKEKTMCEGRGKW